MMLPACYVTHADEGYMALAEVLVRGEDAHGHFIAEQAPLEAFGAAERALYGEVSRRPSGFGKVV